jgi:putative ABC transport system substrate-binding protein
VIFIPAFVAGGIRDTNAWAFRRATGPSRPGRRRVLLSSLGLLVAHRQSYGQPTSKIPRIGFLCFGSSETPTALRNRVVFRQRLAALGYVEGKTIVIEERFAEGNAVRLGELARELAASKVDVIVTPAVTTSRAARQATVTIPIVMVHAGDPVGAGLIASLARPGGNVTGTRNLSYSGKQVELSRELVPRGGQVCMLLNPPTPTHMPT